MARFEAAMLLMSSTVEMIALPLAPPLALD
jgi:hypothetical protein